MRFLPGKRNCAADFRSRYPALYTQPDDSDEDLAHDLELAMAAATVSALTNNDSITLDDSAVLQATANDPVYQLHVAKVQEGDWHPHRSQEIACLG